MLLLLALLGCRKVEPAPEALDDLVQWFWDLYEDGEDAQLAQGLVNLDAALDGDLRTEVLDGTVSRLDDEQVQAAGVDREDTADAAGLFTAGPVACDLDGMEAILSYEHLDQLFDVYEQYEREYTSSLADWDSGRSDRVTWWAWYTSTAVTTEFSAELDEGMRRVPALDEGRSPFGDFILLRRVMPAPADFGDSNKSIDQDYKIEVYYERDGGDLMHLHVIWREADFGAGLDQDNESLQRMLLNGMADWDVTAGEHCAAGIPD